MQATSVPSCNDAVDDPLTASCRKALFRNVTRWGPTADEFIRKHAAKYDLVAMTELHLLAEELKDMLHVWDAAGFNAAATPARPLGNFHKTGGVVAGIRKSYQTSTFRHLAALPCQMIGAAELQSLPPGPIDFWDFIPLSWRMRGLNIVAIAA